MDSVPLLVLKTCFRNLSGRILIRGLISLESVAAICWCSPSASMFLTITITAKNMSKITAADTFSSCFIRAFTASKTMVADAISRVKAKQDQDSTRGTTYR